MNFTNLWPVLLILTLGAVTGISDISRRKIFNSHLLLIATAALGFNICTAMMEHAFPAATLWNLTAAALIGIGMYAGNLWRAGDGKLFIVYALLMPPTPQDGTLLLPCLSQFTCAFLLGTTVIILHSIPGMGHEIQRLVTGFRLGKQPMLHPVRLAEKLYTSVLTLLISAAIVLPALSVLPVRIPPLIEFFLMYMISGIISALARRTAIRPPLPVALICFVFLFAFKLKTGSPAQILPLFKTIALYAGWAFLLNLIFQAAKDREDRVPFAPFLFIGCLLAYTPFLSGFYLLSTSWRH